MSKKEPIHYYVVYRQKNGKMKMKPFSHYWEATQKKQSLIRQGYTDVTMQRA